MKKTRYSKLISTGIAITFIYFSLICQIGLADNGTWSTYNPYTVNTGLEGILSNRIIGLAVDDFGNLIAGTPIGIIKFRDKEEVDNYKFPRKLIVSRDLINRFNKIAIDDSGDIWIATKNGIGRFNGTAWKIYSDKDGLALGENISIAIDSRNNIWIANEFGVSMYNGTTWTTYSSIKARSAIVIDEDNNPVVGTKEGISKFNGYRWINYTKPYELSGEIGLIAIDKKNRIWIRTCKSQFDCTISKLSDNKWKTYSKSDGIESGMIYTIVVDKKNNIIVGTNRGVYIYDEYRWTNYNKENGLASDNIYSIAIDKDNNIWVGGYDDSKKGGVSKFDGKKWTTYFFNQITAIAIDKDNN
ncbi:MAG: two-component regulator propeller domain-containing protein, partial [Methanosarcinales archaeon]